MSIRVAILYVVVALLVAYAWKDWLISLCGLVLLTTFSQHHDMPERLFGIPGLNPWNAVLAAVILAWIVHRQRDPLPKPPNYFLLFLIGYVLLITVGFGRAFVDRQTIIQRGVFPDTVHMLFDLLFNPLKYILVGVMMYDGCRTRKRAAICIGTILLFGLLHALMMYKTMGPDVFTGTYEDAKRRFDKLIGLHANDLAGLVTMAFWSSIVVAYAVRGRWRRGAAAMAVIILPCVIGCHSLAAYLSNIGLAGILGVLRWRWLLLAFPAGAVLMLVVFPQLGERFDLAVSGEAARQEEVNLNAVTTGRTQNIWGPAIDAIAKSPIIGYGLGGTARSDAFFGISQNEGRFTGHPHNSYLEIMVDHGIVGLAVVLGLIISTAWMGYRLFCVRDDPLFAIVGGMAFVAIVNVAILGLASSFFYPKESMLSLICPVAVMARLYPARFSVAARRARARTAAAASATAAVYSGGIQ